MLQVAGVLLVDEDLVLLEVDALLLVAVGNHVHVVLQVGVLVEVGDVVLDDLEARLLRQFLVLANLSPVHLQHLGHARADLQAVEVPLLHVPRRQRLLVQSD